MNPPAAAPLLPGWFGKIPALGDFVTRRLPDNFVQRWDDWLSERIPAAQRHYGDDWPQVYGAGACWCFALAAGTVDAQHWTGVMQPSADRVGRRFPLTIAVAGDVPADLRWHRWASMAEAAAQAMGPGCDAQGVDAALTAALGQGNLPAGSGIGLWPGLAAALPLAPASGSLWWRWSEAPGSAEPAWFRAAGLPQVAEFIRFYSAWN